MYRDLDPENWPEEFAIDQHPLIAALLRDGFPDIDPVIADNTPLDTAIPALELNHVVDADSSQTVAIAETTAGRTMVIKGPPGTGKSQTITNIIAALAARGKKVLFVSEKMAALEVVHSRLQKVGLGPMTLELHSNKSNKRSVLEELKRTKEGVLKTPRGDATVVQRLGEATASLNAFATRLHTPLQPSGVTPYQILGRLLFATGQEDAVAGFVLDGAEKWNASDYKHRHSLVEDLAERLRDLGPIPSHPWKGVQAEPLDPSERDDISRLIGDAERHLQSLTTAANFASAELGAPTAVKLADGAVAQRFFDAAATIPGSADRSALRHPAWRDNVDGLAHLVDAGRAWSAARSSLDGTLNAAGWAAEYNAVRSVIARKGRSLFRIFNREYREQLSLLRSYLKVDLPKSAADRISLIDRVVGAQGSRAAFDESRGLAPAFGRLWVDQNTDWSALKAVVDWRQQNDSLPAEYWSNLSDFVDLDAINEVGATLSRAREEIRKNLSKLVGILVLDIERAFGVSDIAGLPLADLQARLSLWKSELESVTRFIAIASRGRELAALGVPSIVNAIHDGMLTFRALTPTFDRAYSEVLRGQLFQSWPELRGFDGDRQNRLVSNFRDFDRARIELAKEQIAANHAAQRPKGNSGIGPLGVLNAELAKRRGHLPIRQLLHRAGPAIQQLKPVFMMSPLSVAQFLKPGGSTFDALVMDEASQIEPVDALGAIARVKQIVVVGDERQLPPTAFFKKLTGDEDRDEEGDDPSIAIQAKDAESILDLCLAKGVPHRMLSWHYRSKHQSLIAVSNKEFYENRLYIVPSPYDAIAGMGLKFRLLKDTAYDRGGSRTNPLEARAIAEAVIAHARSNPSESLGVGTFSVSQRQAILKELELLRRANPDLESFFAATAGEPFFVKNLENIQGDERDVIFISVGYGKTAEGYLAHNFGPLSSDGGQRRLNVLISRAKLRCEVFCNFTGADIDLERTRAQGVAALKMFLTFAETGDFGLGEPVNQDHDSEFEAQVCNKLRSRGYDVKAQIGASGFRVDLAICDPEKPGRFVLGIECDGAQYHSSRSARDRDRLRQQVLEAHGWIIHRIWSADWYMRPEEELKKVEAAITIAKAEWHERDEEDAKPRAAVHVAFGTDVEGDTPVAGFVARETAPSPARNYYREANFPVNRQLDPHETPLAEMAGYVVKIVEIEGPVHIDEVATRIRLLWGLQRAGNRIRAAVSQAAQVAAKRGLIIGEEFYDLPNRDVSVRDRSEVNSSSLRRAEALPPTELTRAIVSTVDDNFGAPRDELIQAVSRLLGYQSLSAQLRQCIALQLDRALESGLLVERDGLIVSPAKPQI
jgi:very-short-patch-repair endonuclease